jgi:hypothetical protein
VLTAFKKFVFLYGQDDIQVPRGTSSTTGFTLTADAQFVSGIDAGGDFYLKIPLADDTFLTPASLAGILNDLPRPTALRTGSGDAEEALLKTNLTVPVAGTACRSATTLSAARSVAFGTKFVTRKVNLLLHAECSLFETQLDIVPKIRSALRTPAASPGPAEEVSKTEDVSQDVAEVGEHIRVEAIEAAASSADAGMTITIILGPLLSVAEYGVSLGRFLELFFRFRIARIAIRVVLHCQLAVGALDFLVGSALAYTENFVIVTPGTQSQISYLPAETATIAARRSLPLSV